MKFLIITLNSTASTVGMLAFMAFVMFAINSIKFYREAFIVFVVCMVIASVTPNSSERKEWWFDTFRKDSDK